MKSYVLIPITILSVVASWFIWTHSPEYVRQGGPLLVAGLTFLFLTMTFAIERFIVLWRAGGRGNVSGFVKSLKEAVHGGDLDTAVASCKKQGGSLANVIGAGLENFRRQTLDIDREQRSRQAEKEQLFSQ